MLSYLPRLAAGYGARKFSTSAATSSSGLLLRDFIHASLYHPVQGYFSRHGSPVGQLPEPLKFSDLMGRSGYEYTVRRLYRQLQVSWLTPAELFQPHYGRAVANGVLARYKELMQGERLNVVEIGGGTGTLAKSILDHIQHREPDIYKHMHYTSVEISPALVEAQRQKLLSSSPTHRGKVSVEQRDATDLAAWGDPSDDPCFFIMTEVLDNLPHDRIVRQAEGEPWHEVVVCLREDGGLEEAARPLSDPLIQRVMRAVQPAAEAEAPPRKSMLQALLAWALNEDQKEGSNAVFVPTGCQALLETLCAARPHHFLIAADFDELPDVAIAGRNAPVVSSKAGATNTDFPTYLLPYGSADIFFPTNFRDLCHMYCAAAHGESSHDVHVMASHMKTQDFMEQHARLLDTQTKGGFNPMLEDFSNTSVFLGHRCL